jgi:hypothetical protein
MLGRLQERNNKWLQEIYSGSKIVFGVQGSVEASMCFRFFEEYFENGLWAEMRESARTKGAKTATRQQAQSAGLLG